MLLWNTKTSTPAPTIAKVPFRGALNSFADLPAYTVHPGQTDKSASSRFPISTVDLKRTPVRTAVGSEAIVGL